MTKCIYDGATIEASTAKDLVSAMHAQSEAPAKTDADWMVEVSNRMRVMTGDVIDATDADRFVQGLIDAGILKIVDGW